MRKSSGLPIFCAKNGTLPQKDNSERTAIVPDLDTAIQENAAGPKKAPPTSSTLPRTSMTTRNASTEGHAVAHHLPDEDLPVFAAGQRRLRYGHVLGHAKKRTEQKAVPTIQVHPLLTAGEVASMLNIGQRTVWRLTSRARAGSGRFPKPLQISPQVVRWRWQDVQDYLAELSGIRWMPGQRRGK